ncbi:histidine--tRNA ligase [Exiguobacterium sp. s192]|uniref:histidine--tRNA ligase n=1 Tax=Exiguobacterium sp. s192 TaxID=2751206 RepID=UPI002553F39C|nr:histidine--tRNA ligase [Exiguobacterium sp. s192]
MRKMDYQNVKGTQDYLPDQEDAKRTIRRTLEDTFIAYGCRPLETPILNYTELMASKYAGGAEILQEMYRLTDRGERDLALRYDLTIPFAKVVAMNPSLAMPFKRYEIGKVFRDGPIKAGRYREFTQCDVDIVGVESQAAEAELMMMALEAFQKLELPVEIQFNNRKLLYGLLQQFAVPEEKMNRVLLVLDKMEKVSIEAMIRELVELELAEKCLVDIRSFIESKAEWTIEYFTGLEQDNPELQQGLMELDELSSYLVRLGIADMCRFNPFLARGLEIYTGTIYEIFLEDGTIRSSIGSGGRYDNAIGGLLKSGQTFSTVGISFGLDVILYAFEQSGRVGKRATTDLYIIPVGTIPEAMKLAVRLRKAGRRVEVELSGKKVNKAMERANREQIPEVIVLGENELQNGFFDIKDMSSGATTRVKYPVRSLI